MLYQGKDIEKQAIPHQLLESRLLRKVKEIPIPEEDRNKIVTKRPDEVEVSFHLEAADGKSDLADAEYVIATFAGKKDHIMRMVAILIQILEKTGGGVGNIQAFEVDNG